MNENCANEIKMEEKSIGKYSLIDCVSNDRCHEWSAITGSRGNYSARRWEKRAGSFMGERAGRNSVERSHVNLLGLTALILEHRE